MNNNLYVCIEKVNCSILAMLINNNFDTPTIAQVYDALSHL